jgi:hypothetical protein
VKKILLFVIAILMCAVSAAAFSGSGSGTSGDPYQVTTCSQLQEMNSYLNTPGVYFKLMNDIDCANFTWTPVGIYGVGPSNSWFQGVLDGNGYSVINLTANRGSYAGLFGNIGANGIVKDLTLVNPSVTGVDKLGALAGRNEGTIQNCHVIDATITSTFTGGGATYSAGLIGVNTGTVTKSSADAIVNQPQANAAVLVAYSQGGTISECYSTGSVNGRYNIGGLVGQMDGGTVNNSYSTADLSTAAAPSGAFGGLVGRVNTAGAVSNSYATGSVPTGTMTWPNGGLVGWLNSGTVTNGYYDSETTGHSDTGKGIPKTTAEMKQMSTFVNWDFVSTWSICEAQTYPWLQWQGAIGPSYTVTVDSADLTDFKITDGISELGAGANTVGTCAVEVKLRSNDQLLSRYLLNQNLNLLNANYDYGEVVYGKNGTAFVDDANSDNMALKQEFAPLATKFISICNAKGRMVGSRICNQDIYKFFESDIDAGSSMTISGNTISVYRTAEYTVIEGDLDDETFSSIFDVDFTIEDGHIPEGTPPTSIPEISQSAMPITVLILVVLSVIVYFVTRK